MFFRPQSVVFFSLPRKFRFEFVWRKVIIGMVERCASQIRESDTNPTFDQLQCFVSDILDDSILETSIFISQKHPNLYPVFSSHSTRYMYTWCLVHPMILSFDCCGFMTITKSEIFWILNITTLTYIHTNKSNWNGIEWTKLLKLWFIRGKKLLSTFQLYSSVLYKYINYLSICLSVCLSASLLVHVLAISLR